MQIYKISVRRGYTKLTKIRTQNEIFWKLVVIRWRSNYLRKISVTDRQQYLCAACKIPRPIGFLFIKIGFSVIIRFLIRIRTIRYTLTRIWGINWNSLTAINETFIRHAIRNNRLPTWCSSTGALPVLDPFGRLRSQLDRHYARIVDTSNYYSVSFFKITNRKITIPYYYYFSAVRAHTVLRHRSEQILDDICAYVFIFPTG